MATNEDYAERLQQLDQRYRHLTKRPARPRPTLSVVEYSLGDQRKAEVYANRLLRYLLDPTEPHRLDGDFLRAFLEALPEDLQFDEPLHDIEDIVVDDQVPVSGEMRTSGATDDADDQEFHLPDLCIQRPGDWFLLIELKFHALENNLHGPGPSQTERYEAATYIDGEPLSQYESGQYYLYLRPADRRCAQAETFQNWTWEALAEDVLEQVLLDGGPRYPQRTVNQLSEFIDVITDLTSMADQTEPNTAEKIDLYLENFELITDLSTTFEDRWSTFSHEWPGLLENRLDVEGVQHNRWSFSRRTDDWNHLFRDGWWREIPAESRDVASLDDLDILHERAGAGQDLRISLVHRLQRNLDRVILDNELHLHLRNCPSNPPPFYDAFGEALNARRDEVESVLPGQGTYTGNNTDPVRFEYSLDPAELEIPDTEDMDVFTVYILALEQAFKDLVANNQAFVRIVEAAQLEAFEEAWQDLQSE